MTNYTDTYWDVDGTSLQTMCQNVESLSSKWSLPAHRGGNITLAYKHGVKLTPKYVGPRTVQLGMWVSGKNSDGSEDTTHGKERRFQENLHTLQDLVWDIFSRPVDLTKRWKDFDTGTVIAATATAEFSGEFEPQMRGPYLAKMVLDFDLEDPFFYGALQTDTLELGSPLIIDHKGRVETRRIGLKFNGQLTNPEITNSSYDPNIKVKVNSAISVSDFVTLDVEQFTAIRDSDNENLIGSITRSGDRSWMKLSPGNNSLALTASGGAGNVIVTHRPAYL